MIKKIVGFDNVLQKKKSRKGHEKSEPQRIFIEEHSRLKELQGVKIVWSNFRGCYKLIQEEGR